MGEVPCHNDGDQNDDDSDQSDNFLTCGIHLSSPLQSPISQKQSIHSSSQKRQFD
jgi:hypothetical protein